MLFICCCDAVISVSDTIAVTVMLLEPPPAFTWLPVLALPNRLGPDTGATAVVDVSLLLLLLLLY
jgi:hypothetical protein